MLEADICSLIEHLNSLCGMRDWANDRQKQLPLLPLNEADVEAFLKLIDDIAKSCGELGLDHSSQTARWARYRHASSPIDLSYVFHHLDGIYTAIVIETSDSIFLKIDPQRADFYSRIDDPERKRQFGDRVEAAFPKSIPEIVGACNCFALEQWTACVFHCMRVLERLMVALAKKFSVSYEASDWYNIINDIEKAVKAIGPEYGPDWKDQQKFFGEAARHLMFMKNAWRNHVMHMRDEYDEGRALSILQHTKELSAHLAEKLCEAP